VISTGKLAGQANGAVRVSMGETEVLVAATASDKPREGVSFFPLTIDVEERMYAVGKIPGSFFRREGRATEKATLSARLITQAALQRTESRGSHIRLDYPHVDPAWQRSSLWQLARE